MSAEEDLRQQLDVYQEQLNQINAALEYDADNEDMKLLKDNLQELVALTKQNIEENEQKVNNCFVVGGKYQAPFSSKVNSTTSFHNAVIFSVDETLKLARVVFSYPVEIAMMPCPFFLDGRCKFTDEKVSEKSFLQKINSLQNMYVLVQVLSWRASVL